jgi:hypothetical protein
MAGRSAAGDINTKEAVAPIAGKRRKAKINVTVFFAKVLPIGYGQQSKLLHFIRFLDQLMNNGVVCRSYCFFLYI